jgi:uncharacterized protein
VHRQEIEGRLRDHGEELRSLHVGSLRLFGSVARGEEVEGSDVDLLVQFNRPVGLFHFVKVKERLEEILGTEVDLVSQGGLKRQLRDRVLAEAVDVA